mgnify:CR=1 FL=1
MMKSALALLSLSLLFACTPEKKAQAPDEGAHSREHGPHGGKVVEVGAHVAHLELLHDENAGSITIHVFGKDLQTPMALDKAPEIKLGTAEGPRVLPTKALDDEKMSFSVTDEALKKHGPQGRISLEIGAKPYNPSLPHMDDH